MESDGVIFLVVAAVLWGVATLVEFLGEPRASRFTLALVSAGLLCLSIALIVERT